MHKRRHLADHLAEFAQPGASYVIGTTFWNDIGALPIVVAIEHHHHATTFDMAECFFGIARFARQAEPQHVHWCSIVIAFETGFRPNGGMATVASDNQICAYLKFTVRGLRLDTDNAPVLFDQARSLRFASASRMSDSPCRDPRRKLRKSHCGINAMNLQRTGRWSK